MGRAGKAGSSVVAGKRGSCTPVPQPGTVYTVTGLPADLDDERDYPAEAMCGSGCGSPVRSASPGSGWEHFSRERGAADPQPLFPGTYLGGVVGYQPMATTRYCGLVTEMSEDCPAKSS
jgi:hypothetical protein